MLGSSDFKDGSGAQARGPRRSASKDRVVRRDVIDSVTYERGSGEGGGYANDEVSIGVDWTGDGVSERKEYRCAFMIVPLLMTSCHHNPLASYLLLSLHCGVHHTAGLPCGCFVSPPSPFIPRVTSHLFLTMYPAAMRGVLPSFCFPLLCHLHSASCHVRRTLSCLTSHFITKSSVSTFFVFIWELLVSSLLSCICAHLCVSYIFARVWNGWMVSNDETVHENTIPVKSV